MALGLWLRWSAAALTAAILSVIAFAVFTVVIARALRFEDPVT